MFFLVPDSCRTYQASLGYAHCDNFGVLEFYAFYRIIWDKWYGQVVQKSKQLEMVGTQLVWSYHYIGVYRNTCVGVIGELQETTNSKKN